MSPPGSRGARGGAEEGTAPAEPLQAALEPWEEALQTYARALGGLPDGASRLGIDTGGTFTDFARLEGGRVVTWKTPSQPSDPGAPVRLEVAERAVAALVVGTTVGTNALLEGRGARVALVTTEGFADLIELARQDRTALYALSQPPEPVLVPPELRFTLRERIGPGGEVEIPVAAADLEALIPRIGAADVDAVAILSLHAWIHDAHERAIETALRRALPGLRISRSAEVLGEIREYERLMATVANASVMPTLERYLDGLGAGARPVGVTLSSGGAAPAALARRYPVRTLLSGPAAGVVAARVLARRFATGPLLTLDMGGTSTDCAWVDPAAGDLALTTAGRIGPWPLAVPSVDLVTVGAGGGSLARRDPAGALCVGPASAGADPGPAAAGRGREPTVTDAALVIGILPPEAPLPAGVRYDRARAEAAVDRLAASLAAPVTDVARAILDGALGHMERALRHASAVRGHDPRGAALLAFGGAGGLFAAALADRLEIGRVIVPPAPGAFSAWGALAAPRRFDWSRSVRIPAAALDGGAPWAPFWQALRPFVPAGPTESGYACVFGVRYPGQASEIDIPVDAEWEAAFHREHERSRGHAAPDIRPVITTLRIVARSLPLDIPPAVSTAPPGLAGPPRPVLWPGDTAPSATAVLARPDLGTAPQSGPLLLVEEGATTAVPPGWQARSLAGGLLELTLRE